MTIKVGVLGASGRMGATVCGAVADDPDLELVAAVDQSHLGEPIATLGGPAGTDIVIESGVDAFSAAGADVVVDFSIAAATRLNAPRLAAAGIHAVIGTTGLEEADLDMLRAAFAQSNVLVAPNFAISAVMMMRLAELAAPHFETVEIIEYHHEKKVDAPSGTAMATAERIAAASGEWLADPTEKEVAKGARGGSGPGGIRVHAVRMRGMVAHQEVIFGAAGQSLTIRQDSYDRSSFMPGVVLAVKRVHEFPGLTVGLDALL